MATFALIGGKENKEILTNKIERHLAMLTNKEKPVFLFCPYAALNNINKSIDKFHNLVKDINCDIIDLTLENVGQFESLLAKCDILYIGGGHCDDLVKFFKDNHLDDILYKHINDNIIFAGSSAGAMLFTKYSMGDKYVYHDNFHNYNYKMVECLGLLNITISPHYQHEDLVIYNDELKNYPYDAFGIEEDTMVVINDNSFYVIKEEKNKSIYYFNKELNYKMIPLYEGENYENGSFRS